MIDNYDDFKQLYENIIKFGLSKENRDTKKYYDLLNIFKSDDVKIVYINIFTYISNIIKKKFLWGGITIKLETFFEIIIELYIMENHSNEIYEYRSGLMGLSFAAKNFLNIFDKLFTFKDEHSMLKSNVLSSYINNLNEYLNLEKTFKSQEYDFIKINNIKTFNLIIEELNDKTTNSHKSIKRYQLLTEFVVVSNLLQDINDDIINSKYSEILKECLEIDTCDLFSGTYIKEIKNITNNNFKIKKQIIHEILIDSDYYIQIDYNNELIYKKIFCKILEK
jgi:hypothetical protein